MSRNTAPKPGFGYNRDQLKPTNLTIMSSLPVIQRMLVEQFDLKIEDLTPEATLESLGLDSLSVIEFMFNLEDELNIKMSDERVELKTLQDVTNLVDKLVAEQTGAVK